MIDRRPGPGAAPDARAASARAARTLRAVLAGVLGGGVVIGAFEAVARLAWPAPAGLDTADAAAVRAALAGAPAGALVALLAAWSAGAVVAGALAAFVGDARAGGADEAQAREACTPGGAMRGRAPHDGADRTSPVSAAIGAGGLLMLAAVANLAALPYPSWMWAGALAFIPCAWLGARALGAWRARRDAA